MLPRPHRLTTSTDFRRVVREGARAGRRTLVVHALVEPGRPSGAGFVVARAVGPAVRRNRVKRRLRHLVRDRWGTLPPGTRLVVRALPPAATEEGRLPTDLDAALRRVLPGAGR